MKLIQLYEELECRYPRTLSCAWDNDGLMVCPSPEKEVRRVMLALDATNAAIRAAADAGCDLLLTHHPLLFRPLKAVTPLSLSGERVISAWNSGVAVISLHTRLDAGDGGVNDALAAALFLPVVSKFGCDDAPELGRIAELPVPYAAADFAEHVRKQLGCPSVFLTGDRPVRRIALVGGDGKDFIHAAIAAGADTLITGAAGYNAALDAAEEGLNLIEAGHYFTEAPVLARLATLCREIAGAECVFFDSNLTKTIF